EDTLRRVTVAEPRRRRNRSFDRLHQITRPFGWALLAGPDDRLRDRAGIAFLAEPLEDGREITLVGLVDDPRRADVRRRIHAHVERRVRRVRESPLGPVDLHRGDAEVEQDRVRLDAVLRELLEHNGEVAAQKTGLDAGAPGEP